MEHDYLKGLSSKIKAILAADRPFYYTAISYGVAISLLTLAIPLSVQSLVNTITFGVLVQPLVVLSMGLLILLALSATFQALQKYTLEMFQRHFYVKTSTDITTKILQAESGYFRERNGVELVNRYFDIMTVQKKMTTLLTDFISIVLQTVVGLIVLAFYHPYFLIFDIVLVILLISTWVFFGKKAVNSAIIESKAKYDTANWIQEVARVQHRFKGHMALNYAVSTADKKIKKYIDKRIIHFRYLFSQVIMLLGIYAVMSAIILGLGGLLVIKGELSIGQLVAAELIVTVILAGIGKSGKHFESFYDLVAAVDKLHAFYELAKEPKQVNKKETKSFDIRFEKVILKASQGYIQYDFNLAFNKTYQLESLSTLSKLVFVDVLTGYRKDYQGNIFLGEYNLQDIEISNLIENIYVFKQAHFFQGTVRENLKMDLENITDAEIFNILEVVDLHTSLNNQDLSLDSEILPSGHPFMPVQLLRLELARIILRKPKVLILTQSFNQLEIRRKTKIINFLETLDCTIILTYDEPIIEEKISLKITNKDIANG